MTSPGHDPQPATPLSRDSRPIAVVAGASGFIGQSLLDPLQRWGYRVRTIGRAPTKRTPTNPAAITRAASTSAEELDHVSWDDLDGIAASIDGADLLINFAGRSVGCRYNDKNRQEIWDSRIHTTATLNRAVATASAPPRLWINASTATIYRHSMDRPQTEADGDIGEGFSVDVAKGWEKAFFAGELPNTRRVAMRMAIVLGDGAALNMLAAAARFGAGGPQFEGRWFGHKRYRGIGPNASGPTIWKGDELSHGLQRFSWVHIDDVVRAIRFIDEHDAVAGPVNVSSPGVSDNSELMSSLRNAVHMPIGIGAPRWLLEVGMTVLRQESELVLKSRWVIPEALETAGFDFEWTELPSAVADLLGPNRR